jgi:hypothetical protein
MTEKELRKRILAALKSQTTIMPTVIGGLPVIDFYTAEQRKRVVDAVLTQIK